jgi:hypothetical protein
MGGAVFNNGGAVAITNSTLTGNRAQGGSGGFFQFGPRGADGQGLGGAVFSRNGTLTITNSTLSGNTAQGGRDVYVLGDGANARATLTNSILGQADTDVSDFVASAINSGTTSTGGSNNLVRSQSGLTGGVVSTADPLLAPLGSYGGPTQTFALPPGSPAIDAGTGTGAPATDQRGVSRGAAVDIGAFESRGFTLSVTGGNNQHAIVGTAFAKALVVQVTSAFGEPVAGGVVTFSAPGGGGSATFPNGRVATVTATGQASLSVGANGTAGAYSVGAAAAGASSTSFSLTNLAPVTPGQAPAAGTYGSPYRQSLTATGGTGSPYTFKVTSGALPGGLALTGDGTLTGTPNAVGDFTFKIQVTDGGGFTGSQTYMLTINKATPALTWPEPADVVYGTALGATQLDATADVAGSFSYTLADGTTGADGAVLPADPNQVLKVTFTPTDTTDYTTAAASTTITVNRATPTLTWPNPADIVYGTALGGTQLDATADAVVNGSTVSVPGTFTYTLADGSTALGAVLAAGQDQTLRVSFTPTDATDFTGASGSTTINVLQATPTLTWVNPTDISYGTPLSATQLDATANVPGTFSYSPASGTVLGAGSHTLSVTFTPADTTDYTTAAASVPLTVDQATLAVTADDATRSYGAANPGLTATITGFVNGESLATSGVTGSPSLSTSATLASPPGTYSITAGLGSLTSANYAFAFVNGTLTVRAAPLSPTGVNFIASAGGPYGGPVATFANPDPIAGTASYTATITWGDGSSSAGIISANGDGTFSVLGTHTYTDPGSYAVGVVLVHNQGFTTPATAGSTATVVSLGQPVQRGMVASPAFWAGASGQALILNFDSGPSSTSLSAWLAATFPNLFGLAAGMCNLTGMSNAEVAVFYQWLRHQRRLKLEAEVLAVALSIYATTPTLAGCLGGLCGFNASGLGLGPLWVSVGRSGSAFGVANHGGLSVWQLLQAIDGRARLGTAYPGSRALQHQAEKVLAALLDTGRLG